MLRADLVEKQTALEIALDTGNTVPTLTIHTSTVPTSTESDATASTSTAVDKVNEQEGC